MEERLVLINKAVNIALSRHLNFFSFRLPGEKRVEFGASFRIVSGTVDNSFLFSPFEHEGNIYAIPADLKAEDLIASAFPFSQFSENKVIPETFDLPDSSTTTAQLRDEIKNIKRQLEISRGGKIIAARTIVFNEGLKIYESFVNLCENYPDAFVFTFFTPQSGLWMGASPEMLLKSEGGILTTMALAGTRWQNSECKLKDEWDEKNIEEQQIVTDFITKEFLNAGIVPVAKGPFTKKAGPVEHLCTLINGNIQDFTNYTAHSDNLATMIQNLIKNLSPTPALSGFPRDEAISVIHSSESFDRGFYGGFCGPYKSWKNFSLYVNLRSLCTSGEKTVLFVGSGITLKSDVETEWEETERKASTLLHHILMN